MLHAAERGLPIDRIVLHELPFDPDGRTPAEQATAVTTPALVLAGTAGPPWMAATARDLADALPQGRLHVLAGTGTSCRRSRSRR